jgi:hypothetical protein
VLLEQELLDENNPARTEPGSYASYLKELKRRYAVKQIAWWKITSSI